MKTRAFVKLATVLMAYGLWLTAYGLRYTAYAYADVPHLIRYQGQAADEQGVPLEGPYTLKFRLYDASAAGTMLWEETHTNVPLGSGHFSVLLGSQTALTAMDWSQPRWLSVQVNGEPELSPRQQITSVPTALRAKVAEQLTVPVATSTITDDDNRLVPSGAIILWSAASCPVGYSRVTALDGRFLVSDATFNASAGGSNTKDLSHEHNPGTYAAASHTHGAGSYGVSPTTTHGGGCCGGGLSNPPATTPVSGTSGSSGPLAVSGTSGTGGPTSLDIRPTFATILLCQKD